MEVLKIGIKNFMSITDVELKPGQVNQIVGKNSQGKTTFIKALEFAAKGSTDGSLVKFGADAAEVIIELDDLTTIKRKLTANGKQTLDVRRGGFQAQSPQTYLDEIFDTSAFNPLELLDVKRRADAILKSIEIKVDAELLAKELGVEANTLPPLDYSQHGLKVIEQAHRYYFQRRAEANKDALAKKNRFETYQGELPSDEKQLPFKREQIHERLAENEKAIHGYKQELADNEKFHATRKMAEAKVERYQARLNAIEHDIRLIDEQMEKLKAQRAGMVRTTEEAKVFIEDAKKEIPTISVDTNAVTEEIDKLETEHEELKGNPKDLERYDAIQRQRKMVGDMEDEYKKAQLFADDLDAKVQRLAGEIKTKLMGAAEMPVEGLEYKDGSFLVKGVPVDNLSASLAMKLAVKVARKLSKRSKLICVDGAESLDEESYDALRTEIDADGYTYFVTKVGLPFSSAKDKVLEMHEGSVKIS